MPNLVRSVHWEEDVWQRMNAKTSSFKDLSRDSPAESALRIPSIIERGSPGSGQPYFDWRVLFPELQILLDNFDSILEEAKTIQKWIPWPEDHFAKNGVTNWTVFPFLHTFPAYDESRQMWIPSTCEHCPNTAAFLRQIPNIRTALFSRLGSGVKVSSRISSLTSCDISRFLLIPDGLTSPIMFSAAISPSSFLQIMCPVCGSTLWNSFI
jgi:hypothetical protein